MFSLRLTIVFASTAIVGLIVLIKRISRLLAIYNNPDSVEVSATQTSAVLEIKRNGAYEIAVKSSSAFSTISYKASLQLVHLNTNKAVNIIPGVNLFIRRRNMLGQRVVAIAECNLIETGEYQMTNLSTEDFKATDTFIIAPKTGYTGFLWIFAIVISGMLFIGGLVLTLLALLKR
jgi:hypothetical protein